MAHCQKFFLILALMHITNEKEINVTVMVPGIDAFSNLVSLVSDLKKNYVDEMKMQQEEQNATRQNESFMQPTSYNYDYDVESTLDSFSSDTPGKTLFQECINLSTKSVNAACVHHYAKFVTYPWSYLFVKPALDIALKTIKTKKVLNGYNINLIYYDSGNKRGSSLERRAQLSSVDSMINDRVVAFIGPINSYAMSRVLTFTAHWDILHLTPGAISSVLREVDLKESGSQNPMIRTGPTAVEVGRCIQAILKYYNWTTTALNLFSDDLDDRYYYFMGEGVYGVLRDLPNFELSFERSTQYTDKTELVASIKAKARVLLINLVMSELESFLNEARDFGYDESFVYIIVDLDDQLGKTPWKFIDTNNTQIEYPGWKKLFQSAIVITLEKRKSSTYHRFLHHFISSIGRDIANDLNFKLKHKVAKDIIAMQQDDYNVHGVNKLFEKNLFPAFFHDSLITLAHVLNKSLTEMPQDIVEKKENTNGCGWISSTTQSKFLNGSSILKKYVANKVFKGVTGNLLFDTDGDRKIRFATLRYDPRKEQLRVVGRYNENTGIYSEAIDIPWPNGAPPPDVPKCGFDGSLCREDLPTPLIAGLIGSLPVFTLGVIFFLTCYIRQEKLKKELQSQLWKVSWNEISFTIAPNFLLSDVKDNRWFGNATIVSGTDPSIGEVISYYVPSFSPSINAKRAVKRKRKWSSNSRKNERIFDVERKSSTGSLISDKLWGGFTTIGSYKEKTVVVKFSNRKKIELSRNVLMELKHMRDITHEHLARFEGACVDWPHICVLTEYCGKGSLKEILLNKEIRMDWMFRVSLMNDLVKGMSFLHNSAIQYHGNLKSTNCVVDSRFVLKITDYGLHSFRNIPTSDDSFRESEKKLWTAPELLRHATNTSVTSQKADVYSFGIILHEIALQKGPFYVENVTLTCKEIISRVRGGCRPYFRPFLDTPELGEDIRNLMEKCWHEDPNERPDFTLTKKIIERFNRENPGNLVENLLHRMEQYAINLEGLVEERTAAYMEEKRKADELLYQMLPVPVVNRLKRGDSVPAEAFESVTICFTDIVGFTSLSAASSPMQIVDLLNDLYTCFDGIIENYDVYKVETIGDAYMLVSGLPVRNGIQHACEIARVSLKLLNAVSNFEIRHRPGDQLKLRIGIHTGPCCAGVVGLKMPRYCLFGDTVNTASRLESSGQSLNIHVSESTKQLLDKYKSFNLKLRGDVPLKGKGTVTTYWLLGETGSDINSLDESEMLV